jgi:hypothetical protein
MAEQPARAGGRTRPQPVAHINRQHQPLVGRPRQRKPSQRQPGQRLHRAVRAQHRIGQLEQLITARCQTGMKLQPEPRQPGQQRAQQHKIRKTPKP